MCGGWRRFVAEATVSSGGKTAAGLFRPAIWTRRLSMNGAPRVNLSSGSFAVVENGREFSLVPWRPVLERQLGREVTGIMRDKGSISWTIGRGRQGPEIGM
jgi:hypothetical protein